MLARVVRRLVRTRVGRQVLAAAAIADPETALGAAGFALERRMYFAGVTCWPPSVDGFEDCAIVFSSNHANHGIAQLTLEEGAHLYRLVKTTPGPHVEIGRYKGGGTFLMAAALRDGDELYSYDTLEKVGRDVDQEIRLALDRYHFGKRVHLIVGDSHVVQLPTTAFGVVFLDGDPSYEGTRSDVERWGDELRKGGHLTLHDATPGASRYDEIGRLVDELTVDPRYGRCPDVGSIVHFVRR